MIRKHRTIICAAGAALSLAALFSLNRLEGGQERPRSSWLASQKLPTPAKESGAGPYELRGLGTVEAQGALWPNGVALVRFKAQNDTKAEIVASKYVADFQAYGAIQALPSSPVGGGMAFEVKDAGVWIVGRQGSEVFVLSGPQADVLQPFAKALKTAEWQSPKERVYPPYLDSFDNAALGIWWMPSTKPKDLLDFFTEYPVTLNFHTQYVGASYAPGVFDVAGTENAIAQAHLIGRPYRLMIWGSGGASGKAPDWWIDEVFLEDHLEMPPRGGLPFSIVSAMGYNMASRTSEIHEEMTIESLQHFMRHFKDDPALLSWLEPHGEFHQRDPAYYVRGDEKRFAEYLQKDKGMTLEEVNEAYGFQARSWDEIPYPETAAFSGRRGLFQDLDSVPWHWQPGELEEGIKAGWTTDAFDDASWASDLRTSPRLLAQFKQAGRVYPLWYRFNATVDPAFKGDGPLYLHVMPNTAGAGRELKLWVNGQEVPADDEDVSGSTLRHAQFDIRKFLKEGENQFVLFSKGGRIAYRVFLSPTSASDYPFPDEHMNRLWVDWNDFHRFEKLKVMERFLKAMRQIDPERPIKVMTPGLFQAEAMELFKRYGAFPQLTGEGSSFRPMNYKGYSRLHGIPGSSEPGNSRPNAAAMQHMFAMIFQENQDAHDYVFDAQRDFWSKKDVVAWWKSNAALLGTLGKVDFGTPQVGLLRDMEQSTRFGHDLETWDLAKGPLPSAGISPVLIDGMDMDKGLADHIPVIFDCSTTVMTPARVEAIRRYVEKGGIFIAQHNTGRYGLVAGEDWPLAKSLGLKITPKWMTDDPSERNEWPMARIRFEKEQNLIPELRGQVTEGSGISIDWQGVERSGALKIEGEGDHVQSIAKWEDGGMAVCEVSLGKGRVVWLGTPFYLRFKDENGKWINDETRQKYFEQLLSGLGIELTSDASDPRIWIEKRESKNGLYDVYMAVAMNGKPTGKEESGDTMMTDLWLGDTAATMVIEPTQNGSPEVTAVTKKDDGLLIKDQSFTANQVRQYAVIRPEAGVEAPLHWLRVQHNHWRALDLKDVPPLETGNITKEEAVRLKTDGIDLSEKWKVWRSSTALPADGAWIASAPSGAEWEDAILRSWLTNGWKDARFARYRRDVVIPDSWKGQRVLLGYKGHSQLTVKGSASLWINGQASPAEFANPMLIDVTDRIRDGKLDLAMEVTGEPMDGGLAGVLYLRALPKPEASISLAGDWVKLEAWHKEGASVKVPGRVDGAIGVRRTFELPADWMDGKVVRLVIERKGNINGVVVNGVGYHRDDTSDTYARNDASDGVAPYGFRIDRWLKPGTNTIDLFPRGHRNTNETKLDADIIDVRLERYDRAAEPDHEIPVRWE